MITNADIGSLKDVLKQFCHVLESRLGVDGELRLVFCQNNLGLRMKFGLHACPAFVCVPLFVSWASCLAKV